MLGLLVAVLATPCVIALSRRGIGLDCPDEGRKWHLHPIPRLGGAPLMLALSIGLIGIFFIMPGVAGEWLPILVGCTLMYGLGLWDDLVPLGAKKKLAGQIAIALLVYFLGLSIDKVSYPGNKWPVELGGLSLPVTIFWLVAVPNIVNLIDGFDGLAGGLGLVMSVTLGVVGLISEQLPVAWFAFTMAGALLGFLVFNFPPAKIFLGDGGAYLIGFMIASMSVQSSHKGSVGAVLAVTVVALGLPIIDTVFALGRRAIRGFPLFHADDEHIHHRLEQLGFSKRRIVVGIYGVCVVLSLVGLSIFWSQGRTLPIAFGVMFLLAIAALRYLHFIRSLEDARARMGRVFSRRAAVRYALLQAQVLELEVDRCPTAEEFWPLFEHTLQRVGFLHPEDENIGMAVRIPMKYNGETPWVLLAPPHVGTEIEWHRIAECFRPVYVKAARKWDFRAKVG